MGIDGGTESIRVGVFDPEGTPLGFGSAAYALRHPRPGWAEQDPGEWWSSLIVAVRKAMAESGVSADEIAGISLDSTACTVVVMDERDHHMRPSIIWMDARASDHARRIGETGDPALKYNGYGAVSAEWMAPKALWIMENEPETYQRAKHICEYTDWLTHRLTGEWTASINNASTKWYHDRDSGGFPESLYGAVGLDDLIGKFPDRVLDMGEVVGPLRREAAEELGLRAGTPVAEGGVDAFVGSVGLGVVEPGKTALITGSSHVILGQSAEPVHGKGFFGSFTDGIIPGQYTVEAGQISTGSIVAWFKNQFADGAIARAEERGVDPYDILNEMAEAVSPGSDGLLVLDYFQGNRTPYTDPLARGMVSGLSLAHTPAHVFRAIIEGVCYGTEHIFRTMRGNDFELKEIVAAGGATKSELWMQTHADVSNVPISFTRVGDAPTLGSAMLAAVGSGLYKDIREAARHMVHVERQIEPDAERHDEYAFYVDKYVEAYPKMKDVMHEMVDHASERPSTG
ncbi:MAG: FGGY-family carbohydrate kinase [Rubrobacteraceae bacterium]